MKSPGRGFTFIELMIVLAMIAALCAIAVPNFLQVQVRSKVARARAGLAALCVALEDYRLDHGDYPPNTPPVDQELRRYIELGPEAYPPAVASPAQRAQPPLPWLSRGSSTLSPLEQASHQALTRLTTPTPYFTILPADPFNLTRGSPYLYANWRAVHTDGLTLPHEGIRVPYVVVSWGPVSSPPWAWPTPCSLTPYDPTNGTISAGNLYDYRR